MKTTKILKVSLVACAVMMLASCSHRKPVDAVGVNDVAGMNNAGAQATGVGQGANWGDNNFGGQMGRNSNRRIYYFDYDRSDVHESDKPSIFANANYLMSHPHARVVVEGHTDPRGSREYNVALGERRANAVANLLRTRGVGYNQVRVVSYGAERLASFGHTEHDYQLDRRAVILYLQK